LSSFRFIIKQQWTIEDISIFSNSSHLEWREGLSDTILKGTHPRIVPTRFGLIWFRGFRGEDLNVKVYNDGCQLMTKAQNELKKRKKRINHRIIDIFTPQITSVI
jgi:methionine salvage enolase-phosphatase E1